MYERYTANALKVLELAQEESRLTSHNFVGTEQLLLGLISERSGIAYEALRRFGVEVNVFGTKTDLVSVMHPTLGEAHLLKDGSRIVTRPGVGNFYDEAGKSIHMAFPSLERPTVSFENKNLTANNKI